MAGRDRWEWRERGAECGTPPTTRSTTPGEMEDKDLSQTANITGYRSTPCLTVALARVVVPLAGANWGLWARGRAAVLPLAGENCAKW
jgi:hypothetical protein